MNSILDVGLLKKKKKPQTAKAIQTKPKCFFFFFGLKGKELSVDRKKKYFDLGLLYAPFWYQCLSTHKKKKL